MKRLQTVWQALVGCVGVDVGVYVCATPLYMLTLGHSTGPSH